MKFSWRANWEILLVLVIIVVGIVITTIAAIRNKDKNPQLVLAEEADFGQLLAGTNAGGFVETATSKQLPEASGDGRESLISSSDDEPPTRRPLLQAMLKTSRPLSSHPVVRQPARSHSTGGYSHIERPPKYEEPNLSEYNRLANGASHSMSLDQQQQQEVPATTGSTGQDGGNLESYDAMSTEPTPNQVNQYIGSNSAAVGGSGQAQENRLHNGRRGHFAHQFNRSQLNHDSNSYGDEMSESVDLIDDIHTTRSSLASGDTSNQHGYTGINLGGAAGVLATQQLDQSSMPMTPSLALYAPYGVTPNSLQQLLSHPNMNHNNHQKLEPQPESSMIDSEDMLGSYAKIPNNSSSSSGNGSVNGLTEAMIRDYNLATAFANSTASQQSQLINSAMLANLMGSMSAASGESLSTSDPFGSTQLHQQAKPSAATHHRAFSASLPISMLLADLLKLTRSHTQSSGAPNDQPSTGGGRPSHAHSILQQLRSLPGPLMTLLQGLSPGGNQNGHDLASLINHDASESNQHYLRVSMSPTDVHSIIARSLQSSSVLPAFPAPKGVPQNFVPPTAGGSPSYHAATNSNADFVAGNAAGFVRAANQQPQLQSQSQSQQQPQQQAQPSQDGYQRSGNSDSPLYNQQLIVDSNNNNMQQNSAHPGTNKQQQQQHYQQYQNNFGNLYDQVDKQSPQQQQQPTVFPANHAPGNVQLDRNWAQHSNAGNFNPNGGRQSGNEVASQDASRRLFKTSNILPQGGNNNKNSGLPDYASYLSFQQAVMDLANPQFNSLNGGIGQMHAQTPFNHAPTYNSRFQNDMQVPLGYNPNLQQRASVPFEFNGGAVESAPKVSIVHANQAQTTGGSGATNMNAGRQASAIGQQQAPIVNQQRQQTAVASAVGKSLTRKRRSLSSSGSIRAEEGRVDEVMSGKYSTNREDDDDSDSRPISVVRLDGQPTNSGRVRGFPADDNEMSAKSVSESSNREQDLSSDRQVAQSQRTANHLKQESHHYPSEHYMSLYNNRHGNRPRGHHRTTFKGDQHNELDQPLRSSNVGSRDYIEAKRAFGGLRKNRKNMIPIETAGSGLMSKLLGTASTTDETEEDADDDDDANEKRKEEIEDAEFGIVNDERHTRPTGGGGGGDASGGDSHPPPSDIISSVRNGDDSSLGSGSNDNEAYTRRNQQRSDIEFYGHSGEETRTLKYGILGSGNYEVVNGGIYPEADESTAAVNSVANYARKPGALLNGLPKLLADHSQSGPQSSYIPGSRLSGFMRGASANPDDLVGLVPAGQLTKDPMGNSMLELIDANSGQLYDPNMMAHLGSSARTTHTTRDNFEYNSNDGFSSVDQPAAQTVKQKFGDDGGGRSQALGPSNDDSSRYIRKKNRDSKSKSTSKANKFKLNSESNELDQGDGSLHMDDDADNGGGHSMQQQQSSISGSRSQGTNQFNSYQILPSRKVTIFSDQDLDSAPSESRVYQR